LGPAGPRLIGRYVSARFAMHGTPLTAREEAAFRCACMFVCCVYM
jgi:diacylglycerol kinase